MDPRDDVRAKTLRDVQDVLDIQPLEFGSGPSGTGRNRAFYTDPPPLDLDGIPGLGPVDSFKSQLLGQGQPVKLLFSGHVGSGKSTQLNRLAVDPEITAAFSVVVLRIEAGLQAFLDSAQLFFLLAGALFEHGKKRGLLKEGSRWEGELKKLDAALFGPSGLEAKEGKLGLQFDLLFVKVTEELKLNQERRKDFRELGETQQTLFQDLLKALTLDIRENLIAKNDLRPLFVIIDDLDKVRGAEQQKDIFDTNLGALFNLPFHILLTVPFGIFVGQSRRMLRSTLDHLYPVRVLDKAPGSADPEQACLPGSTDFFLHVVHHRVQPGVIEDEAVHLAAIYSGGVLRDFFHLLRTAARIALQNKLDRVDARVMRGAIRDERRRESAGLLASDYAALAEVHRTHNLAKDEDRRYLDESRVLQCHGDRMWYEAHPILWPTLPAA